MSEKAIYAVTFLQGQRQTIPSVEYSALTAAKIIDRVAPEDGPRIFTEKAQAPHFVTCPLMVAPYIGKTAERFPAGAEGKQRSSSHVTESAWFAFDLDDITRDDMDTILGGLDGFVFGAYSTHSHGRDAGKVRVRVLLFMDRALSPAEWSRAWHVVNEHVLDCKGDTATARMYQCAAVWTAHPDRVSSSFRIVGRGEPLCSDELLKLAPNPTPQRPKFIPPPTAPGALRSRYEAALCWQDAGEYQTWQGVLMSLRAAVEVGDLADAEARELFVAWSATAPAARQAHNSKAQYSPEAMFDRKPTLTTVAPILVASLFKRARDEAERIVKTELPRKLSARAIRAETYLWRYHREVLKKLRPAAWVS